MGIFRSEEGGRPKLGGFFRQLVAVPQHDCHFWQPHFGRFSLPSFSPLTVVRVRGLPSMTSALEGGEGGSGKVDNSTDLPAYSDTVFSDTPLTVTLLACPK